jgi:hypothetical protein
MNRLPSQHRLSSTRARRGSAYVFVLGISLIVTVLGMGALTLSRVSQKAVSDGNDWEAAGDLAFSATEDAISSINLAAAASPSTWRSSYTSRQTAFTQAVGRGTMSWALKDEVDGNLGEDYLRPFRIYGIGVVGNVTRVYSVQVIPAGTPLDVLRTALHSNSTVTLTGNTQAVNGPISSNSTVSLSGNVTGAIEALSTTGTAQGPPTITAPVPVKTMPSTTIFNDLLQTATAINYNSLTGGNLQNCLLSSTSNPYGSANASGVYTISLPASKNITITNCRIVGTLLISAPNKENINVQGPVEWEPAAGGYPILLVSGSACQVTFAGNPTWLSESQAAVNFDPPGTPYMGQTDSDMLDDYPPQFHGIIHIMGGTASTVSLNANAYFVGTFIADCPVKTTAQCTLIQNPAIQANPPLGYATGNAMAEVPGSWRWDALP